MQATYKSLLLVGLPIRQSTYSFVLRASSTTESYRLVILFDVNICTYKDEADPRGRAVKGVGLRPLAY
jgi:hypothetical protein